MKKELMFITALIFVLSLAVLSDCSRCFSCKQASTPQGCGNTTICNSDEHCFTEQFVTSTGNIVFNSGCSPKANCTVSRRNVQNLRKMSTYMTDTRKRDISICKECCTSDYCNMRGCGVPETPREQRGPYCYHCDGLQDPSSCRNVLQCSKDEVCAVYIHSYSSVQLKGVTTSTCLRQSTCDLQLQDQKCATNCCMEDFCNDHCGKLSNVSVTSSVIQTTTLPHTNMAHTDLSTSPSSRESLSSTTKEHNFTTTTTNKPSPTVTSILDLQCNTSGGYVDLIDSTTHTRLCVHIVPLHLKWNNAENHCLREGGSLVVLDTLDKSHLLRRHLIAHTDGIEYWIGAKHFKDYNTFTWFSWSYKLPIEISKSDWYHNQPDHVVNGQREDCVAVVKKANPNNSFQWHDKACGEELSYICERVLKSGGRTSPPMGISTSNKPITYTSTVGTTRTRSPELRCDTRGGYIDLKSTDGHARLCVHVVGGAHVTWGEAGKRCRAEHGEMVILDTLANSRLLRHKLESMPLTRYWIGAFYLKNNVSDGYLWVNRHHIDRSRADWGHNEPQHILNGDHQNCVASDPRQNFLWYAKLCSETMSYICERKLIQDSH